MDRKKFQNIFVNVDQFLIGSLCDDIELCENIEYPVYTKYFFPPYVSKQLSNMKLGGIKFSMCGLYENCEKNIIGIYPEDDINILQFPIKYFKISNKSKFKTLEHKDYLGSIMSLGIKREMLGDLLVDKDECFGVVIDEIYENIIKNIEMIGRNPVSVKEVSREDIPQPKFELINETVSSLRLDNIVGAIGNLSRTKGLELIENGDVQVNYIQEKDKSVLVTKGDIITIRKKGKYIFEDENGENKKGKIKIIVKKFI